MRKDSLYEVCDICGQQTKQKNNNNNNAVGVLEITYRIHAIFIKRRAFQLSVTDGMNKSLNWLQWA